MATLSNLIKAANVFSAGSKEVRYYLQGVCLYHVGGIIKHVAATNGNGCIVLTLDGNTPIRECEQFIIDNKDIKKVCAMFEGRPAHEVFVEAVRTEAQVVPIDGRFPDISRIIPASSRKAELTNPIRFDMSLLATAGKAVNKLAGRKTKQNRDFYNFDFNFGGVSDSVLMEGFIDGVKVRIVQMPVNQKVRR